MAGLVAQTVEDVTLSSTSIAAGADVAVATIVVDNCVCADFEITVATNTSATEGAEVYFLKKVSGTADNKYLPLSVGKGETKTLWFPLEAGEYELHVKNNDASYAVTLTNPAKLKKYVWQ